MNLKDAKKARDAALADYRLLETSAPKAEVADAALAVKRAQKDVSDAICAGAEPCPICNGDVVGLEHQAPRGGAEYEVGCPACPPIDHEGTKRRVAVRGGLLPRHIVEVWNLRDPSLWTQQR